MIHSRKLNFGDTLVLASHNNGKIEEFTALLKPWRITLVTAAQLALKEPIETENSFFGNARLKAVTTSSASHLPALADDSGFCVRALNNQPGVYSARWAEKNRDFSTAMKRIHDKLIHHDDKHCSFICVLCLAWPDGYYQTYNGSIEGKFTWPPRGEKNHGYDPCFVPEGYKQTFAEMDLEEKNCISHRRIAFDLFIEDCLPIL